MRARGKQLLGGESLVFAEHMIEDDLRGITMSGGVLKEYLIGVINSQFLINKMKLEICSRWNESLLCNTFDVD